MTLHISDDDLTTCMACGLCLAHCPTYRVTGDEVFSPRGRIAAMRLVQDQGADIDSQFLEAIDTCVQCLGCETACPSGVPFGKMMSDTVETLAQTAGTVPWWQRAAYRVLGHQRLLLAGSSALAVAQRTHLVPSKRLGLPDRLPVRRQSLQPSGDDVLLFTGCVMDAWQRDTHAAVKRVVEATGTGVGLLEGMCCGALSEHAGLGDQARSMASRLVAAAPPEVPILVDSAGCGAIMKHYGDLLGTDEAQAFSTRVFDVHEWLAPRLDDLPEPETGPLPALAVQDPCHLRNVQHVHQSVHDVLSRYFDAVALDDEGLCCGAGGAYSVFHRDLAGQIRDRKVDAIGRTGADQVASANPGCAMHLSAAGLDVRHPLEFVDAVLRGYAGRGSNGP